MSLAAISGVIERRILANYRIDPQVVSRVLPAPFRPKLASGYAMGGVCLIRLGQMRPSLLRIPWGLRSENAAHRIAVEWDEAGGVREGVLFHDATQIRDGMCWQEGWCFQWFSGWRNFALRSPRWGFPLTFDP